MGILDFFKKKKADQQSKPKYAQLSPEEEQAILSNEIETFFPTNGRWVSSCFNQSKKLRYENLPCHLRDNGWMSSFLHNILLYDKGIYIPEQSIKTFMDYSVRFNELRHNYELEIVKWQIGCMGKGVGNWLTAKGVGNLSLLSGSDAVEIFRDGVVRTLTAIGMNAEVVEEGIEKNADMFRERYILVGFRNEFEPVLYHGGFLPPADENHKQNWLRVKRYEYYRKHRQSVDKYGSAYPDMRMGKTEANNLYGVLAEQNEARKKVIEERNKKFNNSSSIKSQEDVLGK